MGAALLIGVLWGLPCLIPSYMAEKRGRSGWGWYFFSLLFSFVIGIIVILLLGDTENRRREKILEEEELRNYYRNK